jgi:hypothetical protein
MTIQKINLTKIILQALRLPLLLFVLGLGISNLGLIVNTNPYWLKSVSVAAVAGHVFMAVSWVLFIYAVMAAVIQMYQQTVDCAAHRTLSQSDNHFYHCFYCLAFSTSYFHAGSCRL